jgi:hypothetical protein
MSARTRDQSRDLSRLGMTAERAFGEDQVAVHGHLEHPPGRRDQAKLRLRELLLQLSRQTGGSRLVISDDAVLDHHAHALLLREGTVSRIVAVPGSAAKGAPALGDGAPCQVSPNAVSI